MVRLLASILSGLREGGGEVQESLGLGLLRAGIVLAPATIAKALGFRFSRIRDIVVTRELGEDHHDCRNVRIRARDVGQGPRR